MSTRSLRDGLAAGIKDRDSKPGAAGNRFDRADEALALEKEPAPQPGDATPAAEMVVSGHTAPTSTPVVREIFSMPESDSSLLTSLRHRCKIAGHFASKSEIVRAGLHALEGMSNDEIVAVLGSLEKRRPGRKSSRK